MRCLYFAVDLRRVGLAAIKFPPTSRHHPGAAITRAANLADAVSSDPVSGESRGCEGMAIGAFSCALKCKLQPVDCLTLIGTEGGTILV
jgi:hypothetical protein